MGLAWREEIVASCAFTMAWAADLGADRRRVEAMLAPYDEATTRFAPDLSEVAGMAEGSGEHPVALRATNAFEELYVVLDPEAIAEPLERCTDALLDGVDGPLLVHQEQWYAADVDSVAIVIDRPDDGVGSSPPSWPRACRWWGMNCFGTAMGAMSLTSTHERPGIPRMIVARRALDARDHEEAWRTVTTPERAGGYSWGWAFGDEPRRSSRRPPPRRATCRAPPPTRITRSTARWPRCAPPARTAR